MRLAYHSITWGGVVGDATGVTSVKDLYYRANGSMERAVRDIAAAGYEGTEMFDGNVADYSHRPDDLRQLLGEAGLVLVSVYTGANFIYEQILRDELHRVRRAAELAATFGAEQLVVVGGARRAAGTPTITKLNEAGPVLAPCDLEALTAVVLKETDGVTWLACCGSLPAGAPEDYYATLTSEAHSRGIRTAVDTSGPALQAALDAGPDLVKPNARELTEAIEHPLRTLGDVVDAAQALRERGAKSVLASLGPDGAVLVDDEGAHHGEAPVRRVLSAVGAGDALLAGFLAADGRGLDALRTALAWAAAAVQQEGTVLSGAGSAVTVTVHESVELSRRLAESTKHPAVWFGRRSLSTPPHRSATPVTPVA